MRGPPGGPPVTLANMTPWQLLGAGAPLGVSAVGWVVGPPVVSADGGLSVRYTAYQSRATYNRSGSPLFVCGRGSR